MVTHLVAADLSQAGEDNRFGVGKAVLLALHEQNAVAVNAQTQPKLHALS